MGVWEVYRNPWRSWKERRVVGAPNARIYGDDHHSGFDGCLLCCCGAHRRRAPPRDSEQQPAAWSGQPQPRLPRGLYNLRRLLSEQCEISSWLNAVPQEPDEDSMCCCVPLRTAIFITALGHAILSWALIFARQFVHSEIRIFTGGYSMWSRTIIDVVDVAGAFFCPLGVVGALHLKASYLKAYQYYLILHIPAAMVMYFTDIPLLWNCDLWRTNTQQAIEKYGWNAVVYDLAMSSRCGEERFSFVVKNGLAMLFFLYIVAGTQRFLKELEDEPPYVMRLPKDTPNGAFRAIGLGAASAKPYGGAAPPAFGPPMQRSPSPPFVGSGSPFIVGPPMPGAF